MNQKSRGFEVVTVGEILADLTPERNKYILNSGGAPANVAVNLARLGIKSAVLGKVGDDFIGRGCIDFLKKNGVGVQGIKKIKKYRTGLVFVFIDGRGERDFSFYGHPSADTMLGRGDINIPMIKKSRILHFGSISMMAPKSRAATLAAIKAARGYGKLISYDPNVRLNLWEGRYSEAKKLIRCYFKYADIIKISDNEFEFLFGKKASAQSIDSVFGPGKLVFVTLGKNGCIVKRNGFCRRVPGIKAKTVDTTGAGDAFMAGVLYEMRKFKGVNEPDDKQLVRAAVFANKQGAKCVLKKGAV
ncbi:MAG: carbohydrate kinase family protein [Candidatus Goldiibacteriota bacterium]